MQSLDPSELLLLMQLSSTSLPVGGFSYSEGVESAAEAGCIVDEASASAWLCDQLTLSLARADLSVASEALLAWRAFDKARLQELNQWVLMTRETSETRLQSEQMGRSLADWMKNQTRVQQAQLDFLLQLPPTWPLSFALVLASTAVEPQTALLTYAFSWAENMVQACIKAIPLGQKGGQRILATLREQIPSAVQCALALSDNDRQTFTLGLAILCAQHETQYSRIFRS